MSAPAYPNLSLINGQLLLPDGTAGAPSLSFSSDRNTGFRWAPGRVILTIDGNTKLDMQDTHFSMPASHLFGWSSTSSATGSIDVSLFRDAANTLAQRNAANAQTFNLYNTFTDASNYERVAFKAQSADDVQIVPEAAGSGTLRGLQLSSASGRLGFYGTAAAAKPTITGSRAGNAALADLLTELATLGLITDSSSA